MPFTLGDGLADVGVGKFLNCCRGEVKGSHLLRHRDVGLAIRAVTDGALLREVSLGVGLGEGADRRARQAEEEKVVRIARMLQEIGKSEQREYWEP